MTDEKIRENRLRRMAARQGLRLMKSKRRDPLAYDYGTYTLIDPAALGTVLSMPVNRPYGHDLDAIEAYLTDVERWAREQGRIK